ncbi:hypothetical protein KM803_15420 [Clostridium tyrobutyricum]|uniref:hypothetical protein n=1 Tax=Clostridium tyrobutyricum TaxID=1519 RepID=UPI001C37EF0F|nr:hypothetical protein [Clostridium tyrobutyricum]MBV4432695.1 hypothetical protein [Clostridium tyrobutyricum]
MKEQSIPEDIIELFDTILDYAMTVKSVTGYECANEPDLLAACRIMEKIKKRD